MKEDRSIDAFDVFIQIILIAMILASPLALGAVAPWARSILCVMAAALLSAWLMQGARRGELRVVRSSLWFFILAFFGLALLQIAPLSPSVVKALSPGAWHSYTLAINSYPSTGEARTLSVCSYATVTEIMRLATLATVFFIVVNVVRTRRQIVGIILAMVAVGSFEALYGFAEHFSGHRHIFWLPRQYHLAAVTSTFLNKNHFAGLLEMIVPVSLGLLFAIGRRRGRDMPGRQPREIPEKGFLAAISSPTVSQQVILGALSTVMLLAIFFSLSRAGTVCAVTSLGVFSLFIGFRGGFRRNAIIILLIAAVALAIAAGIGMESIVLRLEEAAGGRSVSWIDRMDLGRSSLALIWDYPLLGTGLGTFGLAFPAYQSARFGDAWADFLHNDWLQAFCEMGVVGGAVVVGGAILLLGVLYRAASDRQDSFCHWIAVGGLAGVGAMLLHSFFDYNLSKITSNGIVFAVVAGLPLAATGIKDRRKDATADFRCRRLYLDTLPSRTAAVLIAMVVVAAASYFCAGPAAADIYFNRYMANTTTGGRADDYFFIATRGAESHRVEAGRSDPYGDDRRESADGVNLLKRALQLQPNNPRYLYYSAYDGLHSAEEFVRLEAEMRAREIAGPELPGDSPEKFELLVSALQDGIRPELFLRRRPFLLEAEDFLHRAINAAPTVARYHATLASVTAELEPASTLALLRAETAGAFAPNKPGILYNAGRIFLAQAPAGKRRDKANRAPDMAYEYFRRAMFADPSYSGRIYSLVESAGGGHADLMSVTPQTISAYERLSSHLWKSEDWDGVLACVEMIEGLVDSRSTLSPFPVFSQRNAEAFQRYNPGDYGWGSPIRGAVGFDHRDSLLIKLSAARRRGAVLEIQGRWSERSEAVSHYRTILREHLAGKTTEARRLRGLGRHKEAMTICLDILQQDWAGPEVLLVAAELASLPRALDYAPEWSAPLDHLYRLVINNTGLSPAEYERATHMLNGAAAGDASDELAAEFVRGAGAVLAGRIDEGVEILATLAARRDETARYWRQGHLIWYYLGQGYERMGRKADAIKAYTRTVEIVPTHRSALLRLNELAGSETAFLAERLASLTPEVPLNIDFGGKIKLLGYTFGKKMAPAETNGATPDREGWLITCYWQFNNRMSQGYRPAIHFCDEQWGNLFQKYSPVRSNNKSYPVDFPRCGEVIVEKHLVNHDLSKARYLRVGIWTATPERFTPEVLHYDAGKGLVRAALPHTGQRVRSELLAGRT